LYERASHFVYRAVTTPRDYEINPGSNPFQRYFMSMTDALGQSDLRPDPESIERAICGPNALGWSSSAQRPGYRIDDDENASH
jgi:hypothetical protein